MFRIPEYEVVITAYADIADGDKGEKLFTLSLIKVGSDAAYQWAAEYLDVLFEDQAGLIEDPDLLTLVADERSLTQDVLEDYHSRGQDMFSRSYWIGKLHYDVEINCVG